MDDDPYAFCYQIEKDAAAAFDKAGLAAFEKQIHRRFEAASADPSAWTYRRGAEILRAIYVAQRNIQAYIALVQQTELKPEDCLAVAKLFVPRETNEALAWAERGRALDRNSQFRSTAAYDLDKLHRELLSKLGRADEALEAAWADFRKHPSELTYDDLMQFVPKTERAAWHEKALNAASGADLHSLLELFIETKETERLADLVRGSADETLENVSHYATEPAAKRLEKNHPGLAARLWRAQGMRIVDAKKSKYYDAALSNFERARDCYQRAGLATEWEKTVRRVCCIALPEDRLHRRISGLGRRRETQRTAFVLRAREDAMGGASAERCSLKTAKRHDPGLPDGRGKERTDETALPINLATPLELIVLSVKQTAARCRVRGSAHIVTLRTGRLWDVGEIVVVQPRKQWSYARNPYLSGEIESRRLDVQALGLAPLKVEDRGKWDPAEQYWGEEGEQIEDWAKPIIAWGPRAEFEMEQVLPGADAEDPFSDPIIESNDRKDSGDIEGANKILMDLCQNDLRCLDAHAHLGNIFFDHWPKLAIRHYEVGVRIGELSLGENLDGLLPWGWMDNRPFLRCMNGFGLCLWRLSRFEEAERILNVCCG